MDRMKIRGKEVRITKEDWKYAIFLVIIGAIVGIIAELIIFLIF